MTATPRQRDPVASIRQRLLNRARDRHVEFQFLLNRYAVERLLYRLSRSPHRDRFLLKGATLFTLWREEAFRPTQDLDLLGRGDAHPTELKRVFRDICGVPVEEDGLRFPRASGRASS